MNTKTCKVCKRELPLQSFRKAHRGEQLVEWACKECINNKPLNMSIRRYRKTFDQEYKDKVNRQKRDSIKKDIPYKQGMLNAAKKRAYQKNLPFNITIDDIIIPEVCPILEVPLIMGTKGNYEYTPSLDRIDNSKGYTKDNVMVISKKANSMKNSASLTELQAFCKNVLRYSPNSIKYENTELGDKEPLS